MIYCPNCGTSLPDDSAFCESCGTAIPQSTAYEAPAYEYAAPAYPSAVRTPAAPVWIVAMVSLAGILFHEYVLLPILNLIPTDTNFGYDVYDLLWYLTFYGSNLGLPMGGIVLYNSTCRKQGLQESCLLLTDAFIPFGCGLMIPDLFNIVSGWIYNITYSITVFTVLWLLGVLTATAVSFFLLRLIIKSRQAAHYPQNTPYTEHQL